MNLAHIPVSQLRDAALAWRRNEMTTNCHYQASGFLKFFLPKPNLQIYDKLDELIDEIERARRSAGEV